MKYNERKSFFSLLAAVVLALGVAGCANLPAGGGGSNGGSPTNVKP